MKNSFLRLFESCQIVIGARRSLICDLQKNSYVFIPNTLAKLITPTKILDLVKIRQRLKDKDVEILDDYIQFLTKNEFVFFCSKEEVESFPELSMKFDYPAHISNAIIDSNKKSNHDYSRIIEKILIPCLCRNLQIRFYDKISLDYLKEIMEVVNNSFVKSLEVIIKDDNKTSDQDLINIVNKFKKTRSLTLHTSNQNRIIQSEAYGRGIVVSIKQKISSEIHCGIIHHNYFNTRIESFTEAKNFNSCLFKKISIDTKGNIKNCPSMSEEFGKVEDFTIERVLTPNFKKYWGVTKDQVEVCKDCEFRYICTDCRAYVEDPDNDEYSKPLKCGYNPYTNEWQEWSTNSLKQKGIEYYNMQDLVEIND